MNESPHPPLLIADLKATLPREGQGEAFLTALLAGAGFEVLHEEGYCWSPFARTSNSPLVPVFVQAERMLGLHRWIALSPWIAFVARKH